MTKTIDVSPGEGWRWLEDNEIIEADDEVFIYTQARFIKPTTRLGKPAGIDGPDGFPVRRRVPQDGQPGQFPQYFRGDRWRDSDAYVRFDSADKCGIAVSSDGSEFECVHYVFADVEECIRHHSWRRLTRAEAEARVKKPEPKCKQECFSGGGSPSPRQCDICGDGPCQKAKPAEKAESPEDWVTQDRVPPRDGIDEYLIENIHMWYVKKKGFEAITLKHGDMVGDIGMLKVRCRRKDLPPPAEYRCAMCNSPAVSGTASCAECYRFALESVGAPTDPVDTARRALNQIAEGYGIKDFETMSPDQIVERITAETQRLATAVGREVEYKMGRYDILFEEMKETISRMEQRLNKMEGVMIPQMIIGPGR